MQTQSNPDPTLDFYSKRLDDLATQSSQLGEQERVVARLRTAGLLGIGIALAAWAGVIPTAIGYPLAALIFIGFVLLVGYHEQVQYRLLCLDLLSAFNRQRLARRARDWSEIPLFRSVAEFAESPVARDLDLFNERSVVRHISEAQTPQGRLELQRWLVEPASPQEVSQRQAAIQNLAPRWEIREQVALGGRILSQSGAMPDEFAAWGAGPAYLTQRLWLSWGARSLALAFLLVLTLLLLGVLPATWSLVVLGLIVGNLVYSALFLGPIHDIFNRVTVGDREIEHYRTLFQMVWDLPDDVPAFHDMRACLSRDSVDFHQALNQLHRCVRLSSGRRSSVWFPIYVLAQFTVAWDFHVMVWLERWQRRYGVVLSSWFEAVAKLEALSSLAALAHDHPDWCYPQVDSTGDDVFSATSLGHPLLPTESCVRNDVCLGPTGRLLLVTGSNMSGKSTLLRSIGVNAMLAQAGSVVCATRLTLQPVRVATSMRVSDSLADGVSFFMAELQRLKAIVDEAQACVDSDRCMLFLLDEILQGTNSRERHLAVERIIGHLLASNATGAVSTHDIDLANSPAISPLSDCVHFRESFVRQEGKETMTFDYRLRQGVCPTTNALKLLEHVGLA